MYDTDGWNKLGLNKSSLIYLVLKSIWTLIKDHIVKCICATWKSHVLISLPQLPSLISKKKKKEKIIGQYLKENLFN